MDLYEPFSQRWTFWYRLQTLDRWVLLDILGTLGTLFKSLAFRFPLQALDLGYLLSTMDL